MRFALRRIGRVVFIRWYEAPGIGDMATILGALAVAKRETGADLVQVEVASATAGVPSLEATRDAMASVRALKFFRVFHSVVIEGDSVHRALARGIYSIMTYALSEDLALFETVEEAVARACAVIGQDPRGVLRELDEAGLLRAPAERVDAATSIR